MAIAAAREVLGVVHDPVRLERSGQLDVPCCTRRSPRRRTLSRSASRTCHASGRAVDQHSLPASTCPWSRSACSAVIPAMGRRRPPRTRGLPASGRARLARGRVLRARAAPSRTPRRRARVGDGAPTASTRPARSRPGRRPRPAHLPPHAREEGPGDAIPLDGVDRGCVHADEHLVVLDRRSLDVPELEHVGPAVPLCDDRLHRVHRLRHCCVPVDRHGRHPVLLRHTL